MNDFSWDIKIPIFKDRLILKQLGFGIGIPFGILIIIMMIFKAYYGILFVAITLILTAFLVMIIFKGTYDVHYLINQKGILCQNQPIQAKRIKILSSITTVFGIFSRNYSAAGAGMLAGNRINVFISWKNIGKIKYLEKQNCIMIKGGFAENIALFCTDENYQEIKLLLAEKIKIKSDK